MLRADHQKVRDLFQDYEEAQDQKAKRKMAQQVFVDLETHAQLEENVFYPASNRRPTRRENSLWRKASRNFLGVGLALLTGWLGGELVDRLGVGVDSGAHLDAPSSLSGRPAHERISTERRGR